MTAALLRKRWTVPRLNSHSNPFSTGESSTAKKKTFKEETLAKLHLRNEGLRGSLLNYSSE